MSESMALVGLDVHQAQTVAAVLDPVSGELRVERLRGVASKVVPVFLEELDRPLRAVYEAGPTGFALARVAEERGLDVRVVAPGSIPRAPGDRVKSDLATAPASVRLLWPVFKYSGSRSHCRRHDGGSAIPVLTTVRECARACPTSWLSEVS